MSNFARVIHHIDMKDVKRKRLEKIVAEKLKEERDKKEKELIKEISRKYKSDWKTELSEKMTTGAVFTTTIAPAEGDGTVNAVDVIDASSYSGTVTGMLGADAKSGNTGSVIRDSGSGSGQDGGFDVGGKYLSFQGDGYNVSGHAIRWAALAPIDSSRISSLTITAIVGNDSNGGEDPDASAEDLRVMYKTPSMDTFRLILFNPSGEAVGATNSDIIIPLGASGNSGLNNYSVEIPEWAREKDTQFALIQLVSSGTGYDNYGITNINFQRKTPINVVVPLDDPQSVSFIRVGTDEGDPKKRKKKLNDQLAAADEYTQAQLGDEFPGAGTRVGGDDPFASAKIGDDVEPSPIGKDEVTKSFADFKKLTDQQKISQSDEYIADYIKTFNNNTYTDPESIAILDRAIELNPKNTDAYLYRSFANFDNQNYEDALKDTDKILEINPDDPDISYMRALIYKEKGDLELSLEEIKKSLENYPEWTYLEDMKAEVEGQIEQEYRAKQVPPDADEEGGVIKRQTYYNDVSEKLAPEETENQQIVDTNLAQAKDLMTTTHYGRGRDGVFSKGAVDLLQDALKVEPNNPEILSNLGVAMLMDRSSSSKEGIEHLERAQALDPSIKIDFGINSWDKYDGEEQQPYAGAKINRLGSLPYRYAREIIKSLPDQSTAKGATYGVVDSDYAKKYGGSYSQFYTDEAKGKSTELLQRMLVSAARKIEDNKYWMDDLGRKLGLDVVGAPGYVLGGTKFTGAINGVTQKDFQREWNALQDMISSEAGGDFLAQNEKVNKIAYQLAADRKIKGLNASIKMSVEKYKAYYDEYMRRGEPDAIEKLDVPEEGTFADTAQKEIIEKAISEPTKLFKLTAAEEKSYNAALEQTGTNSLGYVAALPFALGTSILTGKPQELFIAPSSAIKIAQDINAEELANVLRIDNPVPVTARETIEPSEGKSDKVITTLFGKQGGLYFNYDTETKQLYIESRKTLRTTSGGETVDKFRGDLVGDILFQLPNATGTGTKFTDIPVPSNEQINEIASKIIYKALNQYNVYQDFVDPVVKSGFNPIKIANVIWDGLRGKIKTNDDMRSDAPRTIWDEKSGKMMNNYDYGVAGLKQVFDQNLISDMTTTAASFTVDAGVNAIAANLIALRSILTDIGIPASDIEKFGGAYGMTYSSTPVNFDDLPDEVKKVIETAVGSPQGKPKPKPKPRSGIAGLDEPIVFDKDKKNNVKESTLFERIKSKPFFNPKDIKPVFPENPPPQLDPKTGMHPEYGKTAKRYRKLDPISANAMPPTGDPETDAVVDKQRTKPKSKLFNKLKKHSRKGLTDK